MGEDLELPMGHGNLTALRLEREGRCGGEQRRGEGGNF